MAETVTQYLKPHIETVETQDGRRIRVPDADTLERILWLMQNNIYALAGRGGGNAVLGGPLNMGNVVRGTNNPTPDDDEFLTYKKAREFFSAETMTRELSRRGSSPLNIQGLAGRARDAQLPLVQDFDESLSGYYEDRTLVLRNGVLYLVEPGSPQQVLTSVGAVGLISYGLRSALPSSPLEGEAFLATDFGWLYIERDGAWVYAAGIAFGTDAARLAVSLTASEEAALWFTTDTLTLWRVVSGVWATALRGSDLDSARIKRQSVSTGSVGASSAASVTLTWTTPFADADYLPYASVVEATTTTNTLRVHHIESFSATQVVVTVFNDDAGGAHTGTLNVLGVHN